MHFMSDPVREAYCFAISLVSKNYPFGERRESGVMVVDDHGLVDL
jgi:hypothetical protein